MPLPRPHTVCCTNGGRHPSTSRKIVSTPSRWAAGTLEHLQPFRYSPPKPCSQRYKLRKALPNIPAWSARNRSTALPIRPLQNSGRSQEEIQEPPRRIPPPGRRWPWQERATHVQIFGGQGQDAAPRAANGSEEKDVNNNPANNALAAALARQARRPLHPWHERALRSAPELMFDRGLRIEEEPRPQLAVATGLVPRRKWPWQERALKSHIFPSPEDEKVQDKTRKKYLWDQRPTTADFGDKKKSLSSTNIKNPIKKWPWQERAKESQVFSSPPKIPQKGMYYPWDQRQITMVHTKGPNPKFAESTGYQVEFPKKSLTNFDAIPPAGKRCYGVLGIDGPEKVVRTESKENRDYRRHVQIQEQEEKEIIPRKYLPASEEQEINYRRYLPENEEQKRSHRNYLAAQEEKENIHRRYLAAEEQENQVSFHTNEDEDFEQYYNYPHPAYQSEEDEHFRQEYARHNRHLDPTKSYTVLGDRSNANASTQRFEGHNSNTNTYAEADPNELANQFSSMNIKKTRKDPSMHRTFLRQEDFEDIIGNVSHHSQDQPPHPKEDLERDT